MKHIISTSIITLGLLGLGSATGAQATSMAAEQPQQNDAATSAISASGTDSSSDSALFNFTYSIPTIENDGLYDSGSGTLTAKPGANNGNYLITDISGTTSANGDITGLIDAGQYPAGDNKLSFPNKPYLDIFGVSFNVTGSGNQGSGITNLYASGPDYSQSAPGAGYGTFNVTRIAEGGGGTSSTMVSEPSGLVLLALGLFGLAGVYRWRTPNRKPAMLA